MLRINRGTIGGLVAAFIVALPLASSTSSGAQAHGWPYPDFDNTARQVQNYLSQTKDYLSQKYQQIRYAVRRERDGDGVLIMKLGLGIPYCKGHRATIAIRDGQYFRAVAEARTLGGVRARNIGLMAATLAPGTYYIVHGRCHVRNRVHNIGRPIYDYDQGDRRHAARDEPPIYYRTSYAKFTIEEGQNLNAGFLRFFPSRRKRLRIKLQALPRRDISFLAARFPDLREGLQSRLMERTNAAGITLKVLRRARKKRRQQRNARIVPPVRSGSRAKSAGQPHLIRTPSPTPETGKAVSEQTGNVADPANSTVAARTPISGPKSDQKEYDNRARERVNSKDDSKPVMTMAQRRAACQALLQLKREGKLRQLPVTCLSFSLRKSRTPEDGLPPAKGPDK